MYKRNLQLSFISLAWDMEFQFKIDAWGMYDSGARSGEPLLPTLCCMFYHFSFKHLLQQNDYSHHLLKIYLNLEYVKQMQRIFLTII